MTEAGHNSGVYAHYNSRPVNVPSRKTTPLFNRFWAKVTPGGADECWEWNGARGGGYGQIVFAGARVGAHRIAVVLSGRSLSPGDVVDHMCRNPVCVNPRHLDVVCMAENTRRGVLPQLITEKAKRQTCCKRGHPLFGSNLATSSSGHRSCRQCQAVKAREWRIANRAHVNSQQQARRALGM